MKSLIQRLMMTERIGLRGFWTKKQGKEFAQALAKKTLFDDQREELVFGEWLIRGFHSKASSALIFWFLFSSKEKRNGLKKTFIYLAHACLSSNQQLRSCANNHFYLNILKALPRANALAPLRRWLGWQRAERNRRPEDENRMDRVSNRSVARWRQILKQVLEDAPSTTQPHLRTNSGIHFFSSSAFSRPAYPLTEYHPQ